MAAAAVLAAALSAAWPGAAKAEDLNSYRAKHSRPALSYSSYLSAVAQERAESMARRSRLDHKGFRELARNAGTASAENVLFGCDNEDCAIRMWARSSGHRRNMLSGNYSHYGIASATSDKGRRYWALELGGP
jgi:uncharacterized protein YkwD